MDGRVLARARELGHARRLIRGRTVCSKTRSPALLVGTGWVQISSRQNYPAAPAQDALDFTGILWWAVEGSNL